MSATEIRKLMETVNNEEKPSVDNVQWRLADTPVGTPGHLAAFPDAVEAMVSILAHLEGGGKVDQYHEQFARLMETQDIDGINDFFRPVSLSVWYR